MNDFVRKERRVKFAKKLRVTFLLKKKKYWPIIERVVYSSRQ